MSYTLPIYTSVGPSSITVADNKVDTLNTDLTLVGKNVNSYGQYWNENLIKLLQNFANPIEPSRPVVGQLWYDTSAGRLKINDLTGSFRPITNNIIGDRFPEGLASGDTWFDTVNEQLYLTTDGQTQYLIGPQNSSKYSPTGWIVDTPTDSHDTTQIVTSLFSAGKRVGILSTTTFTLSASSATTLGFTTIKPGLNLNTSIPGIRFAGTATSADALAGFDVNSFIRKGLNEFTTGTITIVNDNGLTVENTAFESLALYANPATHVGTLAYNATNRDFSLEITNVSTGLTPVLYVDSTHKKLGLWNSTPDYPVDITGDTRITGNLYVIGTSTNVQSVNLQVNDKNIELGYGVNTDVGVAGGGITLHGSTDHTISWESDGTGWNFGEHVNLPATYSYKIAGNNVLSRTSLGVTVTSAPGLTTTGVLSYLTVSNILISGTTISTTGTNRTLRLNATGTGTVDVSNLKITSVATPANATDAANKAYVDDSLKLVGTRSFSLTLDVTNYQGDDNYVKTYLDAMFPIYNTSTDVLLNIPALARAKVLCGVTTASIVASTVTITVSTVDVDQGGVQYAATVVNGLTGAVASTAGQTYIPITTYTVQTWRVRDPGDPNSYYWDREA
jgi:hypothetical protein